MITKIKPKAAQLDNVMKFIMKVHEDLFDPLCSSERLAQTSGLTKKEMEMVEQFHRQMLDARAHLGDLRDEIWHRREAIQNKPG